jgi:hypothetical protein
VPYASLFAHHVYGPAAGAGTTLGEGSSTAGLNATGRSQGTTSGLASIINAKATRLRNRPGTASGVASIIDAAPRASGRVTATMNVGATPSASSIASELWGASPAGFTSGGDFAEILKFLGALARNRVVTDPATGTMRIYDVDDTTVLAEADLFADAAGATPYNGSGAERRDRFQ